MNTRRKKKNIVLTIWTFVRKVKSLLFNTLSRFVIGFLPRSKYLLISWLQSPSIVILTPKKMKSVTVSIVSPPICHEIMGLNAMILALSMSSFQPPFSFSSLTFIKKIFSSSSLLPLGHFLPLGWCHLLFEVVNISLCKFDSSF